MLELETRPNIVSLPAVPIELFVQCPIDTTPRSTVSPLSSVDVKGPVIVNYAIFYS